MALAARPAQGFFDTIPDLLRVRAAAAPAAAALHSPPRASLSYGALQGLGDAVVRTLREHGVPRSACVAVMADRPDIAATLFLSSSCAATSAPLNPAYGRSELEFFLTDLHARAVMVSGCADSPVRAVAAELGIPCFECEPHASGRAGDLLIEPLIGRRSPEPLAADRAARPGDVALVLHTSGTTGRPKQVPLTHANLLASASNVANTLRLGPEDLCLNPMPLFHIHGIVAAVLASLSAGAGIVCPEVFRPARFLELLGELPITWYTGVPTVHEALLRSVPGSARPVRTRLRLVRSSSAALGRRTLEELEAAFGVPVIEAFGMTEAAHQVASNGLPPAVRKVGSVGRPAGAEVKVLDPEGKAVGPGERGEVAIRGAGVTSGYVANPDANLDAFTEGWFRTGDQGFVDEEGFLFLTGRFKELINRGGEKVAPLEVDRALMEHPSVAQALSFGVPHPTLGEEVAAAVVLGDGARPSERELREFVSERLAYFKVPRRIVFVPELPRGATGKPQRAGLAGRLGLSEIRAPSDEPEVPPRTPVEEIVAVLWAEVMAPSAGVYEDFFRAGGDSLRATQLVARVRDVLQVDVPLLAFLSRPTVAGLAARVEELLPAEDEPIFTESGVDASPEAS